MRNAESLKKDYYLKGEERFGTVTSSIYNLASSRSPTKGVYGIVVQDVVRSGAKRVLDVGTGPGRVAIGIAKEKKIEVYAVDPSEKMVEIAKRNAGGLRNVHFSLGSSREVPFRGKFDIIFSSASMHHWKDREGSLRYLSSLLSRDGEIRIYEFSRRRATGFRWLMKNHAMSREELLQIGEAASLKVKEIVEIGRYIVAVYAV